MTTVNHSAASGIHPGAYGQTSDPGAVGPGILWVDKTSGPPYQLKLRNTGNSAWETVGIATGFAGEVAGADFAPSGLTGATAAGRYVGATTSGAPVSGTFAVGDYLVDRTGKFWICTSAGTPGTWTAVSAGGTLTTASAYLGSDVTMTSTGTLYDGPSVSLAAGTWLVMGGITRHTVGGNEHSTACLRDGSGTVISSTSHFQATTGQEVGLFLAGIVSPGSTTTYKISAVSDDASALIKAATVYQSQGNNASYILAVKIA